MRSVKFLAKSFSILHVYVRESPNCSSPCSSTCTSEYHPIVRALVLTSTDYQCENHAVEPLAGLLKVYLSFFGHPREIRLIILKTAFLVIREGKKRAESRFLRTGSSRVSRK